MRILPAQPHLDRYLVLGMGDLGVEAREFDGSGDSVELEPVEVEPGHVEAVELDGASLESDERDQRTLGLQDAIRILGLKRSRIRKLAKQGRIGRLVAGRYLYTQAELDAFKSVPRKAGRRPRVASTPVTGSAAAKGVVSSSPSRQLSPQLSPPMAGATVIAVPVAMVQAPSPVEPVGDAAGESGQGAAATMAASEPGSSVPAGFQDGESAVSPAESRVDQHVDALAERAIRDRAAGGAGQLRPGTLLDPLAFM